MMNVFEFLGLPADHRTGNKVVQLVKHLDEVPASRKDELIKYICQTKWDGVFGMIVKRQDGAVGVFGRTGKMLSCVDRLCFEFPNVMPAGVYFGEVFISGMSLEQMSGVVNPNRVNVLDEETDIKLEHGMVFHMHDQVSLEIFKEGEWDESYEERLEALNAAFDRYILPADTIRFRKVNTNLLTLEEAIEWANEEIAEGHEGIVIKHPRAPWKAGHKGWHAMKIVRGVDYDLECIGYEEGTGKYEGKVANLLFRWKGGRIVKCMLGKGWTHEDAAIMFEACDTGTEFDPCGKIFQVYALQESSRGVLRLPKVGERRHDKEEADV